MADQMDIFAEARLRQEKLLEQLAAAPVVDVVGVVAPTGVSGGRSRGEELWTLKMTFDAWRMPGAGLQNRALTIRKKVKDEELAKFRALITPYTVIRIRARVVSESSFGGSEALLEAFVGTDNSDEELNRHAIQLQKPVTVSDPILGTFTLDRRVNWFTGRAAWNGNSIALHLSGAEPAHIEDALKTAHVLWETQTLWNRRVLDCAIQKLLPLKNENWLAEDELEVTADQFKERMALASVTVYPGGSFEFWHNDGDLFWGHSIMVSGNLKEGLTDAGIEG